MVMYMGGGCSDVSGGDGNASTGDMGGMVLKIRWYRENDGGDGVRS